MTANRVAPYVGAWIETLNIKIAPILYQSHPMWVRGLKHNNKRYYRPLLKSHPMWVRGLKLPYLPLFSCNLVAPYVGAWIETYDTVDDVDNSTSHPMWVRGLKRFELSYSYKIYKSHPMWVRGLKLSRGCRRSRLGIVAPYVGAWIETSLRLFVTLSISGRTLCGCVD